MKRVWIMIANNKKYKGMLFIELLVGLTVLGILMACFTAALGQFRRFNHFQLSRQHCIAAAQATLDSITVTGNQIKKEDFKRLWPKVTVLVETSKGKGQWQGLKLVKVKTNAKSLAGNVKVELGRYILTEGRN